MPPPLKDRWPWHRSWLLWWIAVPMAFGASLAAVGYFFKDMGAEAAFFLIFVAAGPVFAGIYGYVGRRVEALLAEQRALARTEGGEVAEALLVIGNLQSPGAVILREDSVTLIAITGKRADVPLAEMLDLKRTRALPGKKLFRKEAFVFRTKDRWPLGFAVTESVAERWAGQLAGA